MKRILILVPIFTAITLVMVLVIGIVKLNKSFRDFENQEEEETVEMFIDSTGIAWRVLTEDNNGNRLIITEYVYGLVAYNSTNIYSFLENSDGLRIALKNWFTETLAPELKVIALPVENVNNDVQLKPRDGNTKCPNESLEILEAFSNRAAFENGPDGWTKAGVGVATPENSLFVLSISEVNKYIDFGTLNKQGFLPSYQPTSWWLRSPGSHVMDPIAVMCTSDSDGPRIISGPATEKHGFRPALWVSL